MRMRKDSAAQRTLKKHVCATGKQSSPLFTRFSWNSMGEPLGSFHTLGSFDRPHANLRSSCQCGYLSPRHNKGGKGVCVCVCPLV
jgi:hypothetical protein